MSMRRSALLAFLCVCLLVVASSAAGASSGVTGTLGSGPGYLLRCFPTGLTVPDQSYTNGQVIDTVAEGCLDGSLSAAIVGSEASSSNVLDIRSSGSTFDTNACGGSVTRAIGTTFFSKIKNTAGTTCNLASLTTSTATDLRTNPSNYGFYFHPSAAIRCYYVGGSIFSVVGTYSNAVEYSIANVLGGYTSGSIPYKAGDQKSSYTYGNSLFIKGDSFTSWTLVWKDNSGSAANVYPCVANGCAGASSFYSLLIPSCDLSATLQPTFLDTFTDADSTSLDAHTPDVGSVWDGSTNTTIQSNKAYMSGGTWETYKNNVLADMLLQLDVTFSDTNNKGPIFRRVDANNLWWFTADNGGTIYLRSYEGGSGTIRASSACTYTMTPTTYKMTVISNGTEISGYMSNCSVSVSSNINQTGSGIGFRLVDTVDNFAVWPLTSATYTSEFAKVGY